MFIKKLKISKIRKKYKNLIITFRKCRESSKDNDESLVFLFIFNFFYTYHIFTIN